MWFRCPEGTTGISVQGQEFGIEVVDKGGRGYFRAPDHFAPLIVDAGFSVSPKPDGTDLPDLPKEDPERDSAIARLTTQILSLQAERDTLLKENVELRSKVENTKEESSTVIESEFAKPKK